MDTSKAGSFSIADFPTNIWARIVVSFSGEQLLRLKMTGSAPLRDCLRDPEVVKSVILGEDVFPFESWPAFLNELPSVEKLVIYSRNNSWWSKFGLKLTLIPSTVRKLKFRGNISNFGELFVQNGRLLNLSEHLPRLESLTFPESGVEDYEWLSSCPPTLTKLAIPDWEVEMELPASLKHLHVVGIPRFGYPYIVKLPPALEKLTSKWLDYQYDFSTVLIPQLPKTMTFLGSAFLSDYGSISNLPPSLTVLEVFTETVKSSYWPLLPQTLTSLKYRAIDPKLLVISRKYGLKSGEKQKFTMVPFDLLPRSLVNLTLDFGSGNLYLDLPPFESVSHPIFPPNLRLLKLDECHLSHNTIKQLPASLKHLEMNTLCEEVCTLLPAGLRTLKASRAFMGPNLFALLPRSLSDMIIWFVTAKDRVFNTSGVEVTARTLEAFSIHARYPEYLQGSPPLPPNLTRLYIHQLSRIGDSFIANNSQNSRDVAFLHAVDFTDLAASLLPRNLTRICFHSSRKITGKCFPQLPRGLLDLRLALASAIFDEDIQHLPRTLERAILMSAKELTPECLRDLPRTLYQLNIRFNEKIPVSCLDALPERIRHSYSEEASFFCAKWKFVLGVALENIHMHLFR